MDIGVLLSCSLLWCSPGKMRTFLSCMKMSTFEMKERFTFAFLVVIFWKVRDVIWERINTSCQQSHVFLRVMLSALHMWRVGGAENLDWWLGKNGIYKGQSLITVLFTLSLFFLWPTNKTKIGMIFAVWVPKGIGYVVGTQIYFLKRWILWGRIFWNASN